LPLADEPEADALDPRETDQDQAPEETEIEREIPDPRTWMADDRIRGHVSDIEAAERIRKALTGIGPFEAGPVYEQVMSVLTAAAKQARIELTAALAAVWELEIPADGTTSVFEAAGRARAYGQEKPPPASV
jgi:hypothetical protein